MQTLGTNYTEAAICVTKNKYSIRLHLYHQLVALSNDVAHGLAQVIAHGLHIDVGIFQFQILEKHSIQIVIIILSGMRQQAVKILPALVNHCGQANDLGARTHNDQKLQLAIFFKLCHISYYLIVKIFLALCARARRYAPPRFYASRLPPLASAPAFGLRRLIFESSTSHLPCISEG